MNKALIIIEKYPIFYDLKDIESLFFQSFIHHIRMI